MVMYLLPRNGERGARLRLTRAQSAVIRHPSRRRASDSAIAAARMPRTHVSAAHYDGALQRDLGMLALLRNGKLALACYFERSLPFSMEAFPPFLYDYQFG